MKNLELKNFHANIQKSFIDNDLEKGTYVNNAENRRLGRVGNKYGGKKSQEKTTAQKISKLENDIERIRFNNNEGNATMAEQKELPSLVKELKELKEGNPKKFAPNSPKSKLNKVFNDLDKFLGESGFNPENKKNDEFISKIEKIVQENNISKEDFNEVAQKFKGLDLLYSDYAGSQDKKQGLKEKFQKIDEALEDDDWSPESKKEQQAIEAVTKFVKENNVTKEEFYKVASNFKGLDLVYEDFK